ncbi:hypothetical protein [Serratia silvae]
MFRASALSYARIMLPMIASVDKVICCREVYAPAK